MSSENSPYQHPGWRKHHLGTLGKRAALVGGSAVLATLAFVSGRTAAPDHPQANDVATPGKALLGMSAPSSLWNKRASEVGPGLQARRIFVGAFTGSLSLATAACNNGMTPVVSFKGDGFSWAQIASGAADTQLVALHQRLVALPCAVFAAIWHEPSSDGTAGDFTRMQVHALPILGGTILDPEVRVGVIGNGWWYNTNGQGYSDSELDAWVGPSVRAVSDFIAADTYQGKSTAEGVASKIKRMGAWARRVNASTPDTPVRALGQGEWNTQSAQAITDACNAIAADPLIAFSNLWNNNGSGSANAKILTGPMLSAFKKCLASW